MAFDVQKTNIEISAVDKTKVAFDSIKGSITNLTGQFGALTGLLGTGAFLAFTKRIIDQADGMNDLSKRTGIAVEQIGAWRLATEQSGTSMEALTSALGKGSKYLVQHGDDLQKIGINAKNSEDLILQLSGIISKMPSDDPRRTALAMQVLGKSAGELIPLLSEGEDGLRQMLARGRELNPVTADLAKNADEFNDSLAELKIVSGGLFVNLVANVLPSFNTYLKQLQAVVNDGDWLEKLGFFTLGYVPGRIADKTEKPEVQIQKYTQRIVELKKELAEFTGGKFGYRKDGILAQIAEAESGLAAQKQRQRGSFNSLTTPAVFDEAAMNEFLKFGGNAPKKDAIAERIKSLGVENSLLAQGVAIEDARTIARLKADGATDQQIVKMLNLTNAQNQYEESEKAAEKTKQDLIKATEDHAEAMQKLLQTADDEVLNAQAQYVESERNLQVMQLGESAVIRMESARLLEAAASAEQGLAYARLNGLSQENIDFTETQILRLKQLAEARLKVAGGIDATTAFEKEKDRIKELADEHKKAEQEVARNREQYVREFSQALTNGLFDSFKKGESFGKAMFRNLTSLAKTVFVREIENLFTGGSGGGILGSVFGKVAKNIPGASGGGFGGGGSIFGTIKDIFSNANGSIVDTISSLGQTISAFGSSGTGILKDIASSIGSFTQLNAGFVSKALPYAGAVLQLAQGNIAGAALTAIGTAIGGPIGGAIGGLLGGAFGKKKPRAKIYSSQAVSSFVDGELQSSNTAQYMTGKRFVALGAEKNLLALNQNFATSINAILKEFNIKNNLDVTSFVGQRKKKARGIFSAALDGQSVFNYDNIIGGNAQQALEQMVDDVMSKGIVAALEKSTLPVGIKKFFTELESKEEVNDAINTIIGLKRSLVDLPPIFNSIRDALDTTAYKVSISDLKARFEAIGTYTSLFYSAEENFATFTKQLTSQFGALNQTLPDTREGFRSLIDGLMNDFSETGRNTFNGLVALSPAADAYYKQLLAQKDAINQVNQALADGLDRNLYSTFADFASAQATVASGGIDTFTARYSSPNAMNEALLAEIKLLREENANMRLTMEAVATYTQETSKIQKRWNGDGLPETRVI